MNDLLQQLLIGIQLGSIYALIALGYTLVYGVLKLINFAHGDVYMVGAYAGLGATFLLGTWLAAHGGPNLIPSPLGAVGILILAMTACGILGLIIEAAAYRPLRTRAWAAPAFFFGAAAAYIVYGIARDANRNVPSAYALAALAWAATALLLRTTQTRKTQVQSSRLTALITAIGVSLFLENFGVLPAIFSSSPRFFPTVVTLAPTVTNGLIFVLSLILMAILTFIITRTKIGKAVRAVSFDADAAALMGINTDKVIAFTFALGASLAGAAGVLVFALQGTKFDPYVGVLYGLKAFVAAVLGGIGNIPGAVIGGLIMGIAETAVASSGFSTYRDAVAFFLLILILLVRPAGLLGKFAPEKV